MSEPHGMASCLGSFDPDAHEWGEGHSTFARFEDWEREAGREDPRDRWYVFSCKRCGAHKRETTGLF